MSDTGIQKKRTLRERRKRRIRQKVFGQAERPRLSVYRSLNHIYAQVVDDATGKTIVAASTLSPELKDGKGKKSERAKEVGKLLAKKCQAVQVAAVVFDRNGFNYHGRIAAVADGAREGGLKF
jgi:large subunit ribosomal protein L18